MKKLAPAVIGLLVLGFLPAAAEAAISARFSLGGGVLRSGDLADGIRGYNDLSASFYGSALQGQFKAPGFGLEPSAEVIIPLGTHWGIGLGAGYSAHSRASEMSYALADASVRESLTAGISSVPIELNLHFFFPVSERITIDAWAGPSYNMLRMSWDYRMTVDLEGQSGTDHFEFKSTRNALGGQAGVGIAFKLSEAFDLTAEVCGRFVAPGATSGDWTETGSGDFWAINDSGTATVWVFDLLYSGNTYRQLSFQESKPSGANVNAAEEAKIGASTFGFRIGFRIRLPFPRSGSRD